jgi:hypothetical protein
MGMPMTANIIHTAKQMVKAKVLAVSTEICRWILLLACVPFATVPAWCVWVAMINSPGSRMAPL